MESTEIKEAKRLVRRIDTHSILTCVSYFDLLEDHNKLGKVLSSNIYQLDALLNSVIQDYFPDRTVNSQFGNHMIKSALEMDENNSDLSYPTIVDLDDKLSAYRTYHLFRKQRVDKGYLFSLLVGKKFYQIVKENLLHYAKLILSFDVSDNWQMKVITSDSQPFKLLNIFITNSNAPQIVHLGANLISLVKDLNDDRNYGYTELSFCDPDKQEKMMTELMKPTYLWEPLPHRTLFKQQLYDIHNQDITPVLDELDQIFDFVCHQVMVDHDMLGNAKYRIPVDVLTLDNLLDQYAIYYDTSMRNVYNSNNETEVQAHSEIQNVIDYIFKHIIY